MQSVAARFPSAEWLEWLREFDAYSRECGLSRDAAGGYLLEDELRERWLEHAVGTSSA